MTSDDVKRGQVRRDHHAEYNVMAVADGYAMVRRKGAMPFVLPVKTVTKHPLASDLPKELGQ